MGAAVVSLCGQPAVARGGMSVLSNVGLPELVAHTEDDYVTIAANLASDLPRLMELRATMRRRMESFAAHGRPSLRAKHRIGISTDVAGVVRESVNGIRLSAWVVRPAIAGSDIYEGMQTIDDTAHRTGERGLRMGAVVFAVIVLIASVRTWAATSGTAQRPNILFIFSDDHAYQAISAYGTGLNRPLPRSPHRGGGDAVLVGA